MSREQGSTTPLNSVTIMHWSNRGLWPQALVALDLYRMLTKPSNMPHGPARTMRFTVGITATSVVSVSVANNL
eukprot:767263-Hanusia_phi.AAC.15